MSHIELAYPSGSPSWMQIFHVITCSSYNDHVREEDVKIDFELVLVQFSVARQYDEVVLHPCDSLLQDVVAHRS